MINEELYYQIMKERPEDFSDTVMYKIIKDRKIIYEFEETSDVQIGLVYKSEYHYMIVDLVTVDGQECFAYERILPVSMQNAIVAIPYMDDGKFILINQDRHPIRKPQLCFPRGFGENGITPSQNAVKELREELDANVLEIQYLGQVSADSGLTSSFVDIFLARVSEIGIKHKYEGITSYEIVKPTELKRLVVQNIIQDSFTLSAYAFMCAHDILGI